MNTFSSINLSSTYPFAYLFFVVVLLALWSIAPPIAAQPSSDAFEQGMVAFQAEQYATSLAHFQEVLQSDPKNGDVYNMMARIYLEQPYPDVDKANKAIDKALRIDPENVSFLETRLWCMKANTSKFFTGARALDRNDLAKKIFRYDSTSIVANLELGLRESAMFFQFHNRISMPQLTTYATPREWRAPQHANGARGLKIDKPPLFADAFDLEKQRQLGGPVMDFSEKAQTNYPVAVEYLNRVITSDPTIQEAYEPLLKLYITSEDFEAASALVQKMQVHFPQHAATWMYSGYIAHQMDLPEAATRHFNIAMNFMSDTERAAFHAIEGLLSPDEKKRYEIDPAHFSANYWIGKDPRFLTSFNERQLEHYARVVYSDLFFRIPGRNLRGWESHRGEVYIKYGPPKSDTFVTGSFVDCGRNLTITNFNIFDYDGFRFVFGNMQGLNNFVHYSPCAKALSHPNALGAVLDYVLIAKDNFKKIPEHYEPTKPLIDFPYLVSIFKGAHSQADVVVPFGVAVPYKPKQGNLSLGITAGAFLISEQYEVLAQQQETTDALPAAQISVFDEAALWIHTMQLEAPPGKLDLSIEFETAGQQVAGAERSALEVPDFNTDNLLLSDILLAYHIEETPNGQPLSPAEFARHGLSIHPAPWGVYAVKQPVYLYFEVYNLTPDMDGATRYEVETVLVEKTDIKGLERLIQQAFGRRNTQGVSTGFESTGTARDESQYVILDASLEQTGNYIVVLRVTDLVSGKTVESRRDLFLE